MQISDFLLARIADNEATTGVGLGDVESLGKVVASEQIRRHTSRSMTITWRAGSETMTRCDVCHHQPAYPCDVLKLMANTHESHPDFNGDWALSRTVVA